MRSVMEWGYDTLRILPCIVPPSSVTVTVTVGVRVGYNALGISHASRLPVGARVGVEVRVGVRVRVRVNQILPRVVLPPIRVRAGVMIPGLGLGL